MKQCVPFKHATGAWPLEAPMIFCTGNGEDLTGSEDAQAE